MARDNDDIADHSQGLTELQTRPANPVLGLKSDPNELDTLGGGGGGSQLLPVNDTAAAQLATTTGGLGQEAKISEWEGYSGFPGWWRWRQRRRRLGTSAAGGGTAWGGSSGSGASPSVGALGTNAGSNAWGAGGSG